MTPTTTPKTTPTTTAITTSSPRVGRRNGRRAWPALKAPDSLENDDIAALLDELGGMEVVLAEAPPAEMGISAPAWGSG